MYKIHFLFPEQCWGVFHDCVFVRSFESHEAAEQWIDTQLFERD